MYYMTLKITDDGNVDTSKAGGIYRYDMKTFECKLLTRIDTGVNGFFNYYKGKIYYVQNEYRDKETNEYTEYIWSCDAKTGKTEKLFQCRRSERSGFLMLRFSGTVRVRRKRCR